MSDPEFDAADLTCVAVRDALLAAVIRTFAFTPHWRHVSNPRFWLVPSRNRRSRTWVLLVAVVMLPHAVVLGFARVPEALSQAAAGDLLRHGDVVTCISPGRGVRRPWLRFAGHLVWAAWMSAFVLVSWWTSRVLPRAVVCVGAVLVVAPALLGAHPLARSRLKGRVEITEFAKAPWSKDNAVPVLNTWLSCLEQQPVGLANEGLLAVYQRRTTPSTQTRLNRGLPGPARHLRPPLWHLEFRPHPRSIGRTETFPFQSRRHR